MTKLEGPLKRELMIGEIAYTLALSPEGFILALKGRRKGFEIKWADLVSGEAALSTALNASLSAHLSPPARATKPIAKTRRRTIKSR